VQPASVRQLRVDLAGTDAAPRIVGARLIDVPGDQIPIPSLAGAAVLVGYGEDGVASSAMPFSLPTVLLWSAPWTARSWARSFRSAKAV
jgi:hypothetical protein